MACEAVFAVVAVVPVEGATVGTACGLAMTGACGRGTAGVACGCWVAAGCVNIGFMTCLGLCPLAMSSPSAVICATCIKVSSTSNRCFCWRDSLNHSRCIISWHGKGRVTDIFVPAFDNVAVCLLPLQAGEEWLDLYLPANRGNARIDPVMNGCRRILCSIHHFSSNRASPTLFSRKWSVSLK